MSYRSFEQLSPSAGSHPSPTANHPGQRKKNVTQGPLFAASQVLRRHRYLLPLGAISASLALGISAYARGERLLKIPYQIPFASRSSVLKDPELKRIFYCGNAQHMYNSLAIMASPFTSSKPMLTSSLLLSGIMIFCGTQYYRTFKREPENVRPLLLVGGFCILTGWLTFLL
ncbi:unnamed protein product [Hermetia illucens]|uniref:Uncharacterized protein n=1 Tax=Hermetia illucens TaxID=343691 RepID=A0A7R8V5X7_HERIL|nr:uncharacterized protein LOC119659767 [Hermetia illucens]CAD7093368.1 unnamed protein product [Hermetia illucens]